MSKIAKIVDVLVGRSHLPMDGLAIYHDAVRIRDAGRLRQGGSVRKLLVVANVLKHYRLRASLNAHDQVEIYGDGAETPLMVLFGRRK